MRNAPESLLAHLSLEPPETLYHYTSLEVLMSIVEKGQLWASNLRYLNDSSELRHVLDILCLRVDALMTTVVNEDRIKLKALKTRLKSAMQRDVFICCFSNNRDDLSQWRGYSPAGRGVCIGFRSSALRGIVNLVSETELAHNTSRNLSFLTEVIYPDEDSGPTFDQVIKNAIDPTRLDQSLLVMSAPFYKNFSFRNEEEWRIVVYHYQRRNAHSDVSYRVGKSTLIPYIQLDLKSVEENFISEVIVGPSPNLDLSFEAVEKMMKARMESVTVTKSSIPYRHW